MPVIVACRCGQRFAAKDHLFGRQVPCPACGNPLLIGRDASPGTEGVCVTCSCGRAFLAPESMRGQQARCRGCGRAIMVPGPDPLGFAPQHGLQPYAAPPGFEPEALPPPVSQEEGEIPWTTLKIMGAIGGSVLLVLVLVTTIVNNWHRAPKVEHIARFVKEAPKF